MITFSVVGLALGPRVGDRCRRSMPDLLSMSVLDSASSTSEFLDRNGTPRIRSVHRPGATRACIVFDLQSLPFVITLTLTQSVCCGGGFSVSIANRLR